ncbi:MAG: RtcB family protein [Nostoc sp.]
MDIGCFVGDTLIPLVDGKSYRIKDLINWGKEFIVYACTPTGKIVAAQATAKLTRRNAPLVKVILDNGEEIICTPDHQFMLRDGSYKEAQLLQAETSLMPFYSKTDKDGYSLIVQPYSNRGLHNHRKKEHQCNHKVVAVNLLNYTEDVYCLTVPEYHNFALKAGVFVHNCGMSAIKTSFTAEQLEGKLKKIRLDIEAAIPTGFNENKDVEKSVINWQHWDDFKDLHRGVQDLQSKAMKQMGSLGGGNHFIEVCLDTENQVWLMLHSGSRNIGNKLAQCHIYTARELAKMAGNKLPDPDLAHFVAGTPEFQAYWHDLQWSQDYARVNRDVMMARFKHIVEKHLVGGKGTKPLLQVNCHHNYAEKEVHFGEDVYVTRKGAVRAQTEDYGIIPGSMGAKSFIVKGKGNAHSFCSCSHGAGRLMSRNKAKNVYTLDDLIEQTNGVECRKDEGVLDEIPGAYKPIEQVMENQADLVEVVATLKQVLCVKG